MRRGERGQEGSLSLRCRPPLDSIGGVHRRKGWHCSILSVLGIEEGRREGGKRETGFNAFVSSSLSSARLQTAFPQCSLHSPFLSLAISILSLSLCQSACLCECALFT